MTEPHARPAPAALLVLALVAGAACGPADGGAEPSHPGAGDAGPFLFVDVTERAGLADFRQESGRPDKPTVLESIGGGVAFLDYDRDGWLDAYLTNGGHLVPPPGEPGAAPADALYRGDGESFVDVTEELGLGDEAWTCGVRTADVDGDGWTDLYLTNWGPNRLLRNRAGRRFDDATEAAGVGDPRWSTGACFLDADRDGDLDLYVANYVVYDPADPPPAGQEYRGVRVYYGPKGMEGERDTFYRNRGDGSFEDATLAAGLSASDGYGFQAVAFDYDADGDTDVYVGNDSTPNYLWRNDGAGRFEDVAFDAGVALSKEGMEQAGMGVAVGDADGDGRFDLYVTNFSEDYFTLYRNDGGGFFSDATVRSGLALETVPMLGWGCGFCDFDFDGDNDLFAVNGHVFPQVDRFDLGTTYRQRNQIFENAGGGRFDEVSGGPGFAVTAASRGAATGDYDEDGDLDLLIGNLDGPPTLLENRTPPRGARLRVELEPTRSNPGAVGAVLTLRAGGRSWTAPYGESSSFLSSNDPRVLFGLGDAEGPAELEVLWPAGGRQVLRDLPLGHDVRVREGTAGAEVRPLGS